nr:LTA synthase family protein [uncultured Cellulosilyticum sp.]
MEDQNRYRNAGQRIELWMSLSLLLYITIECISATSLKTRGLYLLQHMDVFLLNYLIVLIVTAPCVLFHKMLFVFNTFSITLIGLTYANRIMLVIRGLPLRWADFFILKDGLTIANKYVSMPLVIIIGGLVLGATLFLVNSYKFHSEIRHPKILVTFMAVIVILNTVAIIEVQKADEIAQNINEILSEEEETIATDDESISLQRIKEKLKRLEEMRERITPVEKVTQIEEARRQQENEDITKDYEEDGFLYSFLASYESQLGYVPENYDEGRMEVLKKTLEEDINKQDESGRAKPNIIFLQVESFIDPYSLKGVTYDKDPIPYMRPFIEGKNGGILQMPDINTARTEFEILTGIRIAELFPAEVPYTSRKLDDRGLESAPQLLRKAGYYTTAMHNNNSAFYNRSENYNKLGFKQFIPLEGMENVTYMGDWPKDEVFLPYIEKTLKETSELDFIFAVTVGTHSSYHYDYVSENKEIKVSGNVGKDAVSQVQDYVDRLHEADKMIGKLINFVQSNEEPTVLVVYGDHIPTMDVITADSTYPRYEVPFFIVSNESIPEGIVSKDAPKPAYTLYPSLFEAYHLPEGIIGSAQKLFKSDEDYYDKLNLIGYDMVLGKGYLTDDNTLYTPTQLVVQTLPDGEQEKKKE